MPKNFAPKMLSRFVQMARDSLPQIRAGITKFLHDGSQHDALENAYEDLHPLKEATAMFGLVALSHITASVEEMIEDIATAPEPIDTAHGDWVLAALDLIAQYLDSLLADDGREQALVTAAVQAFRRFKGLPEGEDEAAVAALLAEAEDTPAPVPSTASATPASAAVADSQDAMAAPPVQDTGSAPLDMAGELLEGFLLEAEDYLDTIGRLLPDLSDQPEHRDAVQQVRRSVHTLKGAAGVVGLRAVSQLAHRMEDLLDELHDGRRALTQQAKDLLFATFDVLDDFLRDKRGQGQLAPSSQSLYHTYDAVLGTSAPAPLAGDAAQASYLPAVASGPPGG
jgi:chemosensory pili system protein ChpA (sensor histidine kinase/response regulator)